MNRLILRILVITAAVALFSGLGWTGYEFAYKGTVTIEQPGNGINVRILDANNNLVTAGQGTSYRLNPGTYTVSATNSTSGISKTITISSLSDTKITMQTNAQLSVVPLAKTALYGAFTSGGFVFGMNPADRLMTRIDSNGDPTNVLTADFLAGQAGNWEAELPTKINYYQPHQDDKVLVSTNGLIFMASKAAVKELNITGIPVSKTDTIMPQFLIATKTGADDFVVAYQQDIYYYKDVNSAPQKIYTANKKFDSIIYGGNQIGLYYSNMPTSQQDLSPLYNDYQIDLLFVNIAKNNEEQTVKGIINNATLSPDGALATVQPRSAQAYLFNVNDKKRTADIETPLIAGPTWLDATSYVYGKKATVWKYNAQDQSSVLLGGFQNDVTYIRKEASTGGFIVTTYTDKQNAEIYRLGGPAEVADKYAKIRTVLPYSTVNYSINFTNVDKPTILIDTFAPLNTASQLPRYRQETAQFRQDALNYLANSGVDLTGIAIVFNPADPL